MTSPITAPLSAASDAVQPSPSAPPCPAAEALSHDAAATDGHSEADRLHKWDETSLKAKVMWLILLAAVAGVFLAQVERAMGHQLWPMMLGLSLLMAGLGLLVHAWIVQPFDSLVHRAQVLGRSGTVRALKHLPVKRSDEIGKIAQAMQSIGSMAVRHQMEARQLRRTLDQRVEHATRKATRKLQDMAYRDPLTGLGNRRFLDEQLEPLVNLARASRTDLLCILIDIDNFKQVNDELGHAVGDELLAMLGGLIRASVREDDLAVRLGGDEFAIFMTGAPMQRAWQFTESLRNIFVQQCQGRYPQGPTPNLSIGVADMAHTACRSGDELLIHADRQLYAAKRTGKGRTCGLPQHCELSYQPT